MSVGYGRGYYGTGQLEKKPKRRNWFTLVAVLGVGGAVAWLVWPRKVPFNRAALSTMPEVDPGAKALMAASPSALLSSGTSVTGTPFGGFQKQLEDDARAQGFVQVKDFEDSVVASAKQLQAAGAKVVLAPHLEHLATRLPPANEPSHAEIQQLWQPRDLRDEELRGEPRPDPRDYRNAEFRRELRPDPRDYRNAEFRRDSRPDPRDFRDAERRDMRCDPRDADRRDTRSNLRDAEFSTRKTSSRRNAYDEEPGPSRRSGYAHTGRRTLSRDDRDIAEDDLYDDTRRRSDFASRPRR